MQSEHESDVVEEKEEVKLTFKEKTVLLVDVIMNLKDINLRRTHRCVTSTKLEDDVRLGKVTTHHNYKTVDQIPLISSILTITKEHVRWAISTIQEQNLQEEGAEVDISNEAYNDYLDSINCTPRTYKHKRAPQDQNFCVLVFIEDHDNKQGPGGSRRRRRHVGVSRVIGVKKYTILFCEKYTLDVYLPHVLYDVTVTPRGKPWTLGKQQTLIKECTKGWVTIPTITR